MTDTLKYKLTKEAQDCIVEIKEKAETLSRVSPTHCDDTFMLNINRIGCTNSRDKAFFDDEDMRIKTSVVRTDILKSLAGDILKGELDACMQGNPMFEDTSPIASCPQGYRKEKTDKGFSCTK